MEEQERSVKRIAAKLVKVMSEVAHVAKNGTNEFHRYQYATAADVLEKVNDALVGNKICSVANAELLSLENVVNAKGNQEHFATVRMNIRLIDSDSGEYVDIAGLGNGQDSGDKAVMKAETASIKYAYMMAFNISTGDDPEADSRTDQFEAAPQTVALPRVVGKSNASYNSGAVCNDCGTRISDKVAQFSEKRFGIGLCMNCQRQHQAV